MIIFFLMDGNFDNEIGGVKTNLKKNEYQQFSFENDIDSEANLYDDNVLF